MPKSIEGPATFEPTDEGHTTFDINEKGTPDSFTYRSEDLRTEYRANEALHESVEQETSDAEQLAQIREALRSETKG